MNRILRLLVALAWINSTNAAAGGFLQISSNKAAGVRIYLRYAEGYTNTSFQNVSAGGNNKLEFYIRKISGDVNFSNINIFINARSTLFLTPALGSLASVGSDWVKFSVALSSLKSSSGAAPAHRS
jgi:hypothetical protein